MDKPLLKSISIPKRQTRRLHETNYLCRKSKSFSEAVNVRLEYETTVQGSFSIMHIKACNTQRQNLQ